MSLKDRPLAICIPVPLPIRVDHDRLIFREEDVPTVLDWIRTVVEEIAPNTPDKEG